MPKVSALMPNGCFPFVRLPLELRYKIHGRLLIISCCQPGVTKKESWELRRYPDRDEDPSVQILLVSRTIRDEAQPILYSRNTFITAAIHEYEWNHVFEMFLGSFEGPHPQNWPQNELDEPLVKDMWVATHQDLVRDVGKIFDPEFAALPLWLFVGESSESEPNLEVDYDHGIGRQFPAFLRQIGQQNTATIERVELLFGDLVRGADYFPIYAEILRQHFPKLRRLLIDFDAINDYGSDRDWNEPNMYGMKGREQYTDDAVMALFEGIRTLFKDISSLTELALYNCYDGFEEIGEAIVEEKRGGKAFDLRKLWESITPNRDYGTGSGHPFPHPIHTNKNASLSNLPRLSLF